MKRDESMWAVINVHPRSESTLLGSIARTRKEALERGRAVFLREVLGETRERFSALFDEHFKKGWKRLQRVTVSWEARR